MSEATSLLNTDAVRAFVTGRLTASGGSGDTQGALRLKLLAAVDREAARAIAGAIDYAEKAGAVVAIRRHPSGNRYALAGFGTPVPATPEKPKPKTRQQRLGPFSELSAPVTTAPSMMAAVPRTVPRQASHCKGDLASPGLEQYRRYAEGRFTDAGRAALAQKEGER